MKRIDLQNINENDLNELSKLYNFHELTIEDCLSKDSGEKYEKFQNYIYFVFTQLGRYFFYLDIDLIK